MTNQTLFNAPGEGPVGLQEHDAVSLIVRWDWESDARHYWLTHTTLDTITHERIVHGSNQFTWKPGDAVGDCGIAARWIHEARRYLARPIITPRRVG